MLFTFPNMAAYMNGSSDDLKSVFAPAFRSATTISGLATAIAVMRHVVCPCVVCLLVFMYVCVREREREREREKERKKNRDMML